MPYPICHPVLSDVIQGKINGTNENLKQRCFASNRIYIFCSKQKNLSNQASARSKIDLTSTYLNCNDEFSTLVPEQD